MIRGDQIEQQAGSGRYEREGRAGRSSDKKAGSSVVKTDTGARKRVAREAAWPMATRSDPGGFAR